MISLYSSFPAISRKPSPEIQEIASEKTKPISMSIFCSAYDQVLLNLDIATELCKKFIQYLNEELTFFSPVSVDIHQLAGLADGFLTLEQSKGADVVIKGKDFNNLSSLSEPSLFWSTMFRFFDKEFTAVSQASQFPSTLSGWVIDPIEHSGPIWGPDAQSQHVYTLEDLQALKLFFSELQQTISFQINDFQSNAQEISQSYQMNLATNASLIQMMTSLKNKIIQ